MANFMEKLEETMGNVSITENGAVGYKSSGVALLDLNFSVASLRNATDTEIISLWSKAYTENAELAMRWLFYLRDVRQGLGERRTFRVIMNYMAQSFPNTILPLIGVKNAFTGTVGEIIPFYGRWDDMFCMFNGDLKRPIMVVVREQFFKDWQVIQDSEAVQEPKPSISLLAKWLPSITTSSKASRQLARKIAKYLGLTEREYRRRLSKMRAYLDVVEKKMSDQQWDQVNYSAVPSRANLLYGNAFVKHDEERRKAFLEEVLQGAMSMNSGAVYPYEIVHKIREGGEENIQTMEAMWKNLPNVLPKPESRTIVVSDGSASMMMSIGGTKATAMDVAQSVAIYFAEHLTGEFHNKFITFSQHPRLVDLNGRDSLLAKVNECERHTECENTNIEAVFDLILSVGIQNNLKQEDMPENILIASDMEFDCCVATNHTGYAENGVLAPLFANIKAIWEQHGYKLPRIIFWNVNSRTGTIPMTENELGVCLISGFSINLANMVLSGKLDPWECLVDQLESPRYDPISVALGYRHIDEDGNVVPIKKIPAGCPVS